MEGGNSIDGSCANRIPLSDVTNNRGKRAYQLLPGKIIISPGSGATADGDSLENGLMVAKRPHIGSEEPLYPERTQNSLPVLRNTEDGNWKTWTLVEPNKDSPNSSLQPSGEDNVDIFRPVFRVRDDIDCVSLQNHKRGKFSSAMYPAAPFVKGGVIARAGTRSEHASGITLREETENAYAADGEARMEALMDISRTTGCNSGVEDFCHSRLYSTNQEDDATTSDKKMTLDLLDKPCMKINAKALASSDPMVLDQEGIGKEEGICIENSTADAGAGFGLKGPCSCCICATASWLLTDVLYQDYRGRLSEVKKSRKAAGIFVGRSFIRDSTGHSSVAKLEYMMQRWRSLFLRTENALLREGTQLQESIVKLNELRTKCERDLGSNNLFSASRNPD